ncbi:MAG: biopolymer transporter ExbD [Thermodesulfobacteriota bacterium]
MMRFPPRRVRQPTLTFVSMTDLIFLLLIFFLLTSSFVTQEGIDVRLPQVTAAPAEISVEQLVVLSIDRAGQIFLESQPVADDRLAGILAGRLALKDTRTVLVRADQGVVYHRVVAAMDLARRAGADQLLLATERRAASGP